ncbi:MAG: signal peptidase I [Patescibacteria group bacterium]|jgi:signal peptidase I
MTNGEHDMTFVNRILYGGGIVLDLTRWVVFASVLIVVVNTFWLTFFIVDGLSMEPNLHNRELVLLQKSAYRGDGLPQRGEVAVVRYPGDPEHKRYVKRVVGMPGEKVKISDGRVYINGTKLKELYIPATVITEPEGEWQIGTGQYFLMGDNRPNSNDSRYFGPVEKRFLVGKALAIMFPRTSTIETK